LCRIREGDIFLLADSPSLFFQQQNKKEPLPISSFMMGLSGSFYLCPPANNQKQDLHFAPIVPFANIPIL